MRQPAPVEAWAKVTSERAQRKRRRCLRRQFSRHWAMIWFLRGQGMIGRRLRAIYGPDALIWAAGGGIDAEVA